MSSATLLKWAKENEDYAIELRRIAGTDSSRRPVALAAAIIHEQRAKEYRESAKQQSGKAPINTDS